VSLSYLALGDSYTIGEGAGDHERWPVQLARSLRERGTALDDPRIIAKTGWTTEELLTAIEDSGVSGEWDLVTLLAGVNDQYRGHGVARYRETFAELLDRAAGFAKLSKRLIVLSIPDWGVTPFAASREGSGPIGAEGRDRQAIGEELDRFNEVAASLAAQKGAGFVDITPLTRLAATDTALLVSDGLHPSGIMYRMWVERVLPVAARALSAS
jgi:lysophospholipase L1-like esterase